MVTTRRLLVTTPRLLVATQLQLLLLARPRRLRAPGVVPIRERVVISPGRVDTSPCAVALGPGPPALGSRALAPETPTLGAPALGSRSRSRGKKETTAFRSHCGLSQDLAPGPGPRRRAMATDQRRPRAARRRHVPHGGFAPYGMFHPCAIVWPHGGVVPQYRLWGEYKQPLKEHYGTS